ncbi:hypothetical protein Phi12:1_gp29 [Cellulophaga phage phi12:1]|uniref:Uncharacterized protein n=2 Tax=Cellulophaga phage phi12:1 TaxID=1327976 RepID=R9ZZN2_9CAUD|nr:hypothetical protein Phi12:1_gp29 [Cellulophaga phage phi12:1]AGO47995.1 hypothetical protein Phi12:1_gp29 [Cellulophaga phage phi12:1]AGO48160.1 hypothetical protein Phi12:3_gp29 [Cellulophaga phage phi12:3]
MNQREKKRILKKIENVRKNLVSLQSELSELRQDFIGEESYVEDIVNNHLLICGPSGGQYFFPVSCLVDFINTKLEEEVTSNKLSRILNSHGFKKSQKKIGNKLYKGFYAYAKSTLDHEKLIMMISKLCL